jgi:hypothetical protein
MIASIRTKKQIKKIVTTEKTNSITKPKKEEIKIARGEVKEVIITKPNLEIFS